MKFISICAIIASASAVRVADPESWTEDQSAQEIVLLHLTFLRKN